MPEVCGKISLDFNPRSREGSDMVRKLKDMTILISTHAPARGATGITVRKKVRKWISTHAPARGATKCEDSGVVP